MKGIQRILASALLLAPLAAPAFAAGHEEVAAAGIEPAELHCLALTIYFEARGEPMATSAARKTRTRSRTTSWRWMASGPRICR